MNRTYVQPQWIFDSINENILLPVADYLPGATLPAHLSPFVEIKEGDYVPPEKQRLINLKNGIINEATIVNEEVGDDTKEAEVKKKVEVKNKETKKTTDHNDEDDSDEEKEEEGDDDDSDEEEEEYKSTDDDVEEESEEEPVEKKDDKKKKSEEPKVINKIRLIKLFSNNQFKFRNQLRLSVEVKLKLRMPKKC